MTKVGTGPASRSSLDPRARPYRRTPTAGSALRARLAPVGRLEPPEAGALRAQVPRPCALATGVDPRWALAARVVWALQQGDQRPLGVPAGGRVFLGAVG